MLGVWAAVAGSAVFWGTRLLASPAAVPAHASVAVPTAAAGADLSRLLGAEPAPPPVAVAAAPVLPVEASRFQLLGVVAARQAERSQGLALIAVDGKMPRAYRVGSVVDGALVLQAVQSRAVQLGPRGGAAAISLELPALPPPTTGVPGALNGAVPAGGFPVGAAVPGTPGAPLAPAARALPPAFGAIQPVRPPQLAVPVPGARPGFGGLTPGQARNLGVPPGAMQVMPEAANADGQADNDVQPPTPGRQNLR